MSRHMPINWIPRWMEPNYDRDTNLRKLYFLGLYDPIQYDKSILQDKLQPNFYGQIGQDRYLFIAKYHFPESYIPHVTLTTSVSSYVVKNYKSINSLLYESLEPCYCWEQPEDGSPAIVYLKNLDTVSASVISTSGILDLTSTYTSYPIDTDSNIVIKNSFNDLSIVDKTSNIYYASGSIIQVPFNGTYTVYYKSTTRFNELVSGSVYIKIDGETIPIKVSYIKNIWDKFAAPLLNRNKWETNLSLKIRGQHMTIAKKPNQKIAAALGLTSTVSWYTSGATILASGYNDWEFQSFNRAIYVQESPVKIANNFILTYPPTGYVDIFLNGLRVPDTAFTVSGSIIVTNSALLQQAVYPNLSVRYRHQKMSKRQIKKNMTISSYYPDGERYTGILVQDDVLVQNAIKKIKMNEWRWNKDLGKLNGLASFDF